MRCILDHVIRDEIQEQINRRWYDAGHAAYSLVKCAGDAVPTYSLAGRLIASDSGWILLEVPNALVRGVFAALDEPGVELPPGHKGGPLCAHVSVMREEELASIGGAKKVSEIGKRFRYQLGPLKRVTPLGWDDMATVFFLAIESPELKELRRSYGLPPLPMRNGVELKFHCTVAVRRKGVLGRNGTTKAAESVEYYHGSPFAGISELRPQSYVTPHRGIAEIMGRYHIDTGKTWSDKDLRSPHRLGSKPVFLRDREPIGSPFIYSVDADDTQIDRLGNPYEHKTLTALGVKKVEYPALNSLLAAKRESDRGNFAAKHAILLNLIRSDPKAFVVDSKQGKYHGITHGATGFKVHVPASLAAMIPSTSAASVLSKASAFRGVGYSSGIGILLGLDTGSRRKRKEDPEPSSPVPDFSDVIVDQPAELSADELAKAVTPRKRRRKKPPVVAVESEPKYASIVALIRRAGLGW